MSQQFSDPPSILLNYAIPPKHGPGDSGVARLFAWVVILASVGILGWSNYHESQAAPSSAPVAFDPPGMQFEVTGRYSVGVNSLLLKTPEGAQVMVAQIEKAAKSPSEQFASIVVIGELLGKQAARDRLEKVKPPTDADVSEKLKAALMRVYVDGSKTLSTDDHQLLREYLGWFGKAAGTFGQPISDPARAEVIADGQRTMGVALGATAAIGLSVLVGLVVVVILLVLIVDRKFRWNYRPPFAGGGVYLQAFAIYLGGITVLFFAAALLPRSIRHSLSVHIGLMAVPTIVAMLWPLARGVQSWRMDMGWHAGKGTFREISMGLIGYIAGLPVLAVGFIITLIILKATNIQPSHPVEHMLGVSPQLTLIVFALASLYAPFTEETMFRGTFFSALRSRHGWILSAVVSSFIFAAIHPQGWTLIPMLMSIAMVFAGIREWRGTILSSAAAHCLHNTVLVTMSVLMTN